MQQPAIVICRSAHNPARPDFTGGVVCIICECELVISAHARAQIAQGARPLCNPCGFGYAELMRAHGTGVDILLNPAALAQLRERAKKQ